MKPSIYVVLSFFVLGILVILGLLVPNAEVISQSKESALLLMHNGQEAQSKPVKPAVVEPKIILYNPSEGLVTRYPRILVNGRVEGRVPVRVRVNAIEVGVDRKGEFGTWIMLKEGKNTITVEATDSRQMKTTLTRQVVLDTKKPVLTVTEPEDRTITKEKTIRVSGNVYDPDNGKIVSVIVNGIVFPVDRGGNFSGKIYLHEGKNLIVVVAKDGAQNTATVMRTVIRDILPPRLAIFTPANNTITTDSIVTVSGRVEDQTRTKVTIRVNEGREIRVNNGCNGFFKQEVPIGIGKNIIKVTADDAAGNSTTKTRTVTRQGEQELKLIVEEPANGVITGDTTVVVKGKVTAPATVKVNGIDVQTTSDGSFTVPVKLSEGENIITIVATSGSKTLTEARVVIRDTRAPELTITEPEDGYITREVAVTVSGMVEDITDVVVTVNGDTTAVEMDGSFNKVLTLKEGKNRIVVTAIDRGGISTTVERMVRLDTESPELRVSLPPENYITNQPDVVVGGEVHDSTGVKVTVNGAELAVAGDGTFGGTFELVEGKNEFEIRATDAVGNQSIVVRTVTKDTQAPILTITSPANGAVTADSVVTVSGTVSDLTSVELTVNGNAVVVEGDGTFSYRLPLAIGQNTITISAVDTFGQTTSEIRKVKREGEALPPDPATVAPPIDLTVPTTVFNSTSFLYTGDNPIQRGVDSGTIDPIRVAVLRGKVMERNLSPLSGVRITILNHPEYGHTLTRTDGMFDIAVNGGGTIVLNYSKDGYLTVQRKVNTPLLDYFVVDSVIMVKLDPNVTIVNTSDSAQIVQGSIVIDERGTRRATLYFRQGTTAKMIKKAYRIDSVLDGCICRKVRVLDDSTVQELPLMSVRATEYTVGEAGPASMPAELPPTSAYTYCVELSVDEAIAAKAGEVIFDKPVSLYLENFLGFPVGTIIPVGFYDRESGMWIPSPNGFIMKIVGIVDGLAQIDLNGDDIAEPQDSLLAALFDRKELEKLTEMYSVGQTLWRAQIEHFSPCDLNYALWVSQYEISQDQTTSGLPDANSNKPKDPKGNCKGGSIIRVQDQLLGEIVSINGTPIDLCYDSKRTDGYKEANRISIPLTQENVSQNLQWIDVKIQIAGQTSNYRYQPGENIICDYLWDGKDAYGREIQGEQPYTVEITYYTKIFYRLHKKCYDRFFYIIIGSDAEFAGYVTSEECYPDTSTFSFIRGTKKISTGMVGRNSALPFNLGGFSIGIHHIYDPNSRTIYYGSGGIESADYYGPKITKVNGTEGNGIQKVAIGNDGTIYFTHSFDNRVYRRCTTGYVSVLAGNGNSGYSGDGGPAVNAELNSPTGLVVDEDGTVYIADQNNHVIRKVDPYGIITTIAGTGSSGYNGDNILATQAQLSYPTDVELGPDGAIFIADAGNYRVRRIDVNGYIATVAGTGEFGYSGDGGLATLAQLGDIEGIAVSCDGKVYIADYWNNCVRLVNQSGVIIRFAGNGEFGFSEDGGRASEVQMGGPFDVAIGRDGIVYICDVDYNVVRYVKPNGRTGTLAGSIKGFEYVEGGSAKRTSLGRLEDIAVSNDGVVYVSTDNNTVCDASITSLTSFYDEEFYHWIVRIEPVFQGTTLTEKFIPSSDGSELYFFDENGRHMKTFDALTGIRLYSFIYDTTGHLQSILDVDSLATTIKWDGQGRLQSFISPYGQKTDIVLDSVGLISSIRNPAGELFRYTFTQDGLMTSFTDANGNVHSFLYDSVGRLVLDMDPAGGFTALDRSQFSTGFEISVKTAEGRQSKYRLENLPIGGIKRTSTDEAGRTTVDIIPGDGTITSILSDGTTIKTEYSPDPRFGMQAPLTTTITTLPSGLESRVEQYRTISQMTGMEVTGLTDSVVVNDRVYKTIWDGANKLFRSISPEGRETFSWINEKGRVIKDSIPGIEATYYSYNPKGQLITVTQAGRTASYTYDNRGWLATATDPIQRVSRFEYDSVGRITRQVLPDGHEILYTYDANGNLTTLIPPARPAHGFEYNKVDLTTLYAPPVLGTDTLNTRYEYNKDRDVVRVIRPDGGVIETLYDSTGCGSCGPVGRPKKILFDRGALTFGYNPITGTLDTLISPEDTLLYSYDGTLPTSVTWRGGVVGTVSVTYDENLRVTSQSINGNNTIDFAYDNDGLLTKVGAMDITREAATGRISGTTLGNVTTSQSYSTLGELASYHAKYGTNTIFGTNYQRDSLGRITQITEAVEGVATVKRYSYDIAGRLEKVWRNDTLVSVYIYDANGNRISHWTSSRVDSGSYDAQDRMLSYGNAQYFYTPNGELKMKVEGTDTTFYTYDYFGNLKTVILPNKDRIDYIIDGQNRKIGKKVNGQIVKKWIYSGQLTPVAELDSTGNITARFAGSYMIKDGNTYQLITDHLGSVRLVVDVATGTVMQRLDYDEHGNVSYDSNPDFTPFGFCGGLYDNQTKLTRFGARDYDAETGRWTAKDPIGFGGGVSNLYEYCLNDPINLFDRKGFQVIYGQESPSNIVMTFNGNTLTIKTNVGNGIIIGMYPAISGPYGKGRLPEGIYEATNLRRRTMKGMVCPGEEMGWSIDLSDAPGRDYLRIHPDAPPEGTEGCIGVLCSVSEDFYNQVKPYFEAGTPMVYLYVQY